MTENSAPERSQSVWSGFVLDTPWHKFRIDTPLLNGQAAFVLLTLLFIAFGAMFLPNPNLLTLTTVGQLVMFSGLSLFFAFFCHVIFTLTQTGSARLTTRHVFDKILARDNMVRAIPTVLLVGLFMFTFPSFKSQIPTINPFSWDASIAKLDLAMHFGVSPWRLIAAVTGYGTFTVKIDQFYYLWFPVIFTATAAVALIPGHNVWRHRYLLSFILTWIVVGCVLAVTLSSAGPIFFDRLHSGVSEFTPLIAQLDAVNSQHALRTMMVRDSLWEAYQTPAGQVIAGISAMPSMHNAICVLMFLAARHAHRVIAILAGLYAIMIFVGSVHLGWHYALDGYVSAIVVTCIWKFTGWHANRVANLAKA